MISKKDILKKYQKTKAVVIIHYGGQCDDLEFYLNLKKYNLPH